MTEKLLSAILREKPFLQNAIDYIYHLGENEEYSTIALQLEISYAYGVSADFDYIEYLATRIGSYLFGESHEYKYRKRFTE